MTTVIELLNITLVVESTSLATEYKVAILVPKRFSKGGKPLSLSVRILVHSFNKK